MPFLLFPSLYLFPGYFVFIFFGIKSQFKFYRFLYTYLKQHNKLIYFSKRKFLSCPKAFYCFFISIVRNLFLVFVIARCISCFRITIIVQVRAYNAAVICFALLFLIRLMFFCIFSLLFSLFLPKSESFWCIFILNIPRKKRIFHTNVMKRRFSVTKKF